MYYLIGRDLDGDGQYEFIQDMDNMILTEDSKRALQMTETQLAYIDMEYLNQAGFYALEADRFNVSILEELLFSTLVHGFRPRVAPPPRRARRVPPPPPPRPRRVPHPHRRAVSAMGILGGLLDPGAPRPVRRKGPKPRPASPRAGIGPGPKARKPAARPAARPGAGRRPAGAGGRPGGAGRRGPGGRGPGR